MKQSAVVQEQFGSTAQAYLTSAVHARGADLDALKALAAGEQAPEVLDLGCGAGHVSFAMAAAARSVTAYDLAQPMLDVVAAAAAERGLGNVRVQRGEAEHLPFEDECFDIVATRFSAHHWSDVPAALREARRVLRPGGLLVVIDIIASEDPLRDTLLQAVEILRDVSHVRDYRVSEWLGMLGAAGFAVRRQDVWRLKMEFDVWVARMRTPPERVAAIRSLFDAAAAEARSGFGVTDDHSFYLDSAFFEARKL